MTNIPTPPPIIRLPLPNDRLTYQQLSTDFYPWTEVLLDLERRQDSEFSAVMDIQEEVRWARFVWVRGALRGGVGAGGADVDLQTAMMALPRASVTLATVDPLVAEIIWSCRSTTPKLLATTWPDAFDELNRERFYGALISGGNCSFWDSGRVVTGALPQTSVPCIVVSPVTSVDRNALLHFWKILIEVAHRTNPAFSETWRQVSMQLSAEHMALDPFAHDISVRAGQLQVSSDVSVQEFRPAILAAFQGTLVRLGMRVSDLPLSNLRDQEVWKISGLEAQ